MGGLLQARVAVVSPRPNVSTGRKREVESMQLKARAFCLEQPIKAVAARPVEPIYTYIVHILDGVGKEGSKKGLLNMSHRSLSLT